MLKPLAPVLFARVVLTLCGRYSGRGAIPASGDADSTRAPSRVACSASVAIPSGGSLVYPSFLRGAGADAATGIAIDGSGAGYTVGASSTASLITLAPTSKGPITSRLIISSDPAHPSCHVQLSGEGK